MLLDVILANLKVLLFYNYPTNFVLKAFLIHSMQQNYLP